MDSTSTPRPAVRRFRARPTRAVPPNCVNCIEPSSRIVRPFRMDDGARPPSKFVSPCCDRRARGARLRSRTSFPARTSWIYRRQAMAELVGALAMSHGPQLMVKPDRWDVLHNRQGKDLPVRPDLARETLQDKWAKFQRCMDAIDVLRRKLEAWTPDILVMVADDQHENILDDAMPPITIFVGEEFEASVSLSYFKEPKSANRTKYRAAPVLAQGLVETLMEAGFDPAYSKLVRYEGGMGHAFARVLKFLTPAATVPVVPIMLNTYFPPAPSAKRCVAFGQALAAAIRSAPARGKVLLVASGGLSHTLIDEALDHGVLNAMKSNDLAYLSAIPSSILVAGTSEIRNWIVTAAAVNRPATVVEYIPLYRIPTGVGCGMGFAYWDS